MPKKNVNSIDINYNIIGDGEPVLLIHGLGSSNIDWEEQIKCIGEQYKVISFDLRGHGESDKPKGPYSIPLFAKDTAELIKSLDIKKANIIGISLGGMISFQMAIDYPELIKSMVIINSTPEVVPRSINDHFKVFSRQLIARLLGMRKMGMILSKRLFPKENQKDLRELFVNRWSKNKPKPWLASLKAIVGWSVTEKIKEIKTKTLVVTADNDYTPVSVKEKYVAEMQNAELKIIKDSRHGTPIDQPEKLNEIIMDFLK